MPKTIAIGQKARLKPVIEIAARLGIPRRYLELFGDYEAKVSLDILKKLKTKRKRARYIVVTGITPTHLGEGKTLTAIGLSMTLNKLGHRAISAIRQPSLGPFFGIKGGGLGGGRSQVLPSDDISIHFTGDIHAVTASHNLLASFLDNHLIRGNQLEINPDKIFWNRVVDTNDRALRNIRIGVGSAYERKTRFDISASSELMAILALSESIPDLRKRIGKIVVAMDRHGKPVTAEDLKAAGSMALLLTAALKPNLVQTIENTPCFVHTGPFANITQGNSSIVADRMALGLADFVVTEAGFGADCGLEKFVDIKCRQSGLVPDAGVLVASVRALKVHSGRFNTSPGKPLDAGIYRENLDALEQGSSNLKKQIDNVRIFGIPCIVSINKFPTDTDREIERVRRLALEYGAFDCVVSDFYRFGSKGGVQLAGSVMKTHDAKNSFRFLYPDKLTIKEKIETIAKRIYGAGGVRFEKEAAENIARFEKLKMGRLPVCMAKTHLSLSHDPKLKGRPEGFILPVRDVRPSLGAGFLYALCGNVETMPGLPGHPVGERIDIDAKGRMVIK